MENRFQYFTNDEMSNEEYHNPESWTAEYVSGSSLSEIFATCPAAWKYAKREETKALVFGTQSHTVMLENERFHEQYARAPMASEIENAITSQAALASKLKACGLIGTSGKQYPDLIEMMVKNDLNLNVMYLIDLIAECEARAAGKELVKAEDYDNCLQMRANLMTVKKHELCINSKTAQRELSIFGEIFGVKVKVRLDHVDEITDAELIKSYGFDPELFPSIIVITDYKTTQTVKPADFGRHAFNLGYYLKMALQRDLFKAAFQEERPIVVRLLAQEKKEPFLPLAFRMTTEQLKLGRGQYTSVIHQFAECVKHDVWPNYENDADEIELPTPDFVKYQYKEIFTQDQ